MKAILTWIKYLYRITAGFRSNVLGRAVAGIVNVALTLAFVWISKYTIDCVTGGEHCERSRLMLLLGLLALCLLSAIAITQLSKYIENRTTVKMTNRLSRQLFGGLMICTLDEGRYRFHSGDMLNRLTVDLKSLVEFVVTQLPAMVVMAVQVVASFIFLAYLNSALAIIALVVMPVCLLGGKLFFRKQRRLSAEIRNNEGLLHVTMQEGLRHRSTLQSLESVDVILDRQLELQGRLDDNSRHKARLTVFSGFMTRMGFTIGYLVAFGWGVYSLNLGLITFGTLTAFIQLVNRLQAPIAGLAGHLPSFVNNSVAIDRLMEIEKHIPEHSEHKSLIIDGAAGIKISHLTFAYDKGDDCVFRDFSYDFAPGSKTAIVGETGIGKTTLVKLFLGLLSPQEGSISLYGQGKEYSASPSTRCNFVYVPQGNTLLNGTIRENLLLANPDATDDALADVLHTAAADFVFDLPMGLDTPCDESGNGLSEGQAQRIAIARALLRAGSIMLFDEFNSALDSATAETLTSRIIASHPHSTIIFISHRANILPHCDSILNLNQSPL